MSIFFLRKKKKKGQFGVTALSDHCAIKIKWVYLMLNRDSLKGGLVTTIVSLKNEWAEFPLTWKCDLKSVGKQQAKGCVHVKIESTISALVPWKVCWARIRLKIYIYIHLHGAIPHFQNALFNKSWYSLFTFLLAVKYSPQKGQHLSSFIWLLFKQILDKNKVVLPHLWFVISI